MLCACALAITGCANVPSAPDAGEKIQAASIYNPYPESAPVHTSYARFVIRMHDDPTVQAFVAKTTRENAFRKGTDLSLTGLKRLDDASLETRMRIWSKILDDASEAECVSIMQGPSSTPGLSAMDAGLIKLNQTDADSWFALAGDATLAELRQDPIPSVKREDVNEALSRIKATLSPQERLKFASALQNLRAVSPSDACWTMRILFREGTALAEPYRAAIARASLPH
ncbi:hypothetical protein LMG24238_00089 [Paraburkholderia sediminicola]|uniref:Uncharacterized protein n=2 Tax=Paraburkholderia sediminicola TaxID=458836 RepID=A0A6J4ZUL2_9BURK|nr:hypothetical protein LMG24238_00089 [Paraburkholderia sediminicola]